MKKTLLLINIIVIACLLMACSSATEEKKLLNPDYPITITVWNYYNGSVKVKFDSLVTEFNETVGMEHGIVVESQSYGDVNKLADAIFDSASKTIGAQPMPDIFAAYPDNAFRVHQITELVDLEKYFSEDELSKIRKEFLEEGKFGNDQKLRILPIAKSTENLYLNKTYWDKFVDETGANIEDLSTWEGLVSVAEAYYKHTGKAFFCIDSNANYMLLSSMQLGEELYKYSGDRAKLIFNEEIAYKIWNNYYAPYIKGYFAKAGRFSSDDAKIGKIISYVGSTAGASYFPTEVADGETSFPIEALTLSYPYFKEGKPYAIQQGAGMSIAKSDKPHEYGASIFLKWFTDKPQNVKFSVSTAYFPVQVDALNEEGILRELNKAHVSNYAITKSIQTTLKMFNKYTFYGNRAFEGSYDMRSLLENHLFNRVKSDLEHLDERVLAGEDRKAVIEELIAKDQFLQWYQQFKKEGEQILNK